MHTAEKDGYYKLIMDAKTDAQQLAAFAKIKTEVARYCCMLAVTENGCSSCEGTRYCFTKLTDSLLPQ